VSYEHGEWMYRRYVRHSHHQDERPNHRENQPYSPGVHEVQLDEVVVDGEDYPGFFDVSCSRPLSFGRWRPGVIGHWSPHDSSKVLPSIIDVS